MKKKLFLLLCTLLTMIGVQNVKAYTTTDLVNAGCTKETSSLTDVSNKYFILVDAGAGYTSGMSVKHDENNSGSLYYQALGHPLSKNQMWKLSKSGDNYTIQALNDDCYVNAKSAGWNRTVDASESTGKFTITLDGGVWHIVSTGSYDPGSTFGPWQGTKTDGTDMRVAINKKDNQEAGNGDNAPGFYLYSLPRFQDVTSTYITNPSFETDETDTETPTGWTISGTAGTKKVVDADSEIGDGYGKVTTLTDGTKGYGIRQAWAEATFSIYQSVTLPAAFYVLIVDEKSVYAAEGSSKTPSFKLYAGGTQSENFAFTTQLANSNSFFPTYDFWTKSLSFYSDGLKAVDIGVSISFMDKRNDVLLDNFKLYSYPAATSSDYAALKDALDAVEGKILGFEVGEYAPYTNKDAIVALANAKAINPSVPNMQSTVQGATAALTSAIWTPNASRMNAFYRGDFDEYTNSDLEGENSRATAIGWSNTTLANCGVVGLQNSEPAQGGETNPGLAGLTSKKALYLRGGFSTAYGSTPGYTVPLKANAIYTLSFTYGGWGQFMNNAGTVKVKDGSSTDVLSQSVNTTGKGNESTEAWQTFNEHVKTNEAGNYTVDLNFVAGGQSAFSDFSLLFQNYMVKASATELPAGNMTADTWYYFDIATEGGYKLTASDDLNNIKYVTDGTLAENTPGTAFSVDANNVVNLTVGRYYVKSSSTQSLTVAVYAIATAEDYENLNAAINAAENNIGFEDGEYAPYNNKAMLTTLAEAKAINQSVDNPQATVQGYTTALAAANWTANDGEVNAIRWNIADYPDIGAETKVPTGGFVGSDSGSRISHKSADGGNVGLRGLDQYMALMVISNTNATYGETEGYTLPLKANTIYEFKFKYAGWGECGTPTITILKGSDIIKNVELSKPARTGNDNEDAWEAASVVFQANAAGDYKVKFSTSDGRDAFGDLELKKATASAKMQVSGVAKMGTFCAPFDVEIPSGVKAYTLSEGSNASWVHMNEVSGTTIDAGTPVLLTSDEKVEKDFEANMAVLEPDNSGLLKGVFVKTPVAKDANNYLLQYQDSKCAFYLVSDNGINIGKNRCYLNIDAKNSARIAIGGEDGPTAINEIEVIESEAKTMKDGKYLVKGRIVLVKNGKAFGANGQKLN